MAAFRTSRRNVLIGGAAAVASQSVLAAFGKGQQSTKDSPNKGNNTGQKTRVQAVVIGSGFGGSIAAHRLGEKGIETLVLERGRRWTVDEKQNTFCTNENPDGRSGWLTDKAPIFKPKKIEKETGMIETLSEDGITVWASCGVGGGSLVYNTVLLQPTRENFNRCYPKEVSYEEMDKEYYPRVIELMEAGPIPDDVLNTPYYKNARLCNALMQTAGVPSKRLNVGTNWHVVRKEINGALKPSAISGEIWYGANSGYKNSLDKNYLKYAEESGNVSIEDHANVTQIAEDGNGFIVTYNKIDTKGNILSIEKIKADKVFLGAGSMGTTSLLMRAKHTGTLPKLNDEIGKHWGNNGDTFAVFAAGEETNYKQGGPAHFLGADYDENPYGPQSMIAFPMWVSPKNSITFLGMSIPKQSGYWDYDTKSDKATLHWDGKSKAMKNLVAGMEHTCAKFEAVRDANPRTRNNVPEAMRKTKADASATAHPCGGAAMGKACDLYGRVKGYKGLYVTDAAFIPLSTAATNPALTIAAFAERSMDHVIKNDF